MYYTIGEMARKLNLAPSTLRYYDKEGLLPFVERTQGGIRMFNSKDLEWLTVIECLKETGMSIRDIKAFMDLTAEGDASIDKRLQIIQKQLKAVEEQIAQMQETLNVLKYKEWYYETAKAAGTLEVHNTMLPEQIPADMREIKENITH